MARLTQGPEQDAMSGVERLIHDGNGYKLFWALFIASQLTAAEIPKVSPKLEEEIASRDERGVIVGT